MAPSTAPVVKLAFIDALKARPALDGVQVSYGFLSRGLRTETIAVGRIEWDTEDWAALGNTRKEENYWIELYVWVQRKGLSQRQSTERAFALLAEIEMMLREQPMLAGVNLIEFDPVAVTEAPSKEGYQTMAEARVRVKARK